MLWSVGGERRRSSETQRSPRFQRACYSVDYCYSSESDAFHHVQAKDIYNSDPQDKELQHRPVTGCDIYFWQEQLPAFEMLWCIDYMGLQDIVSAHPGFTNVLWMFHVFKSMKWFIKTGCQWMVESRGCLLNRKAWCLWGTSCPIFPSLVRLLWTHLRWGVLQQRCAYFWECRGDWLDVVLMLELCISSCQALWISVLLSF